MISCLLLDCCTAASVTDEEEEKRGGEKKGIGDRGERNGRLQMLFLSVYFIIFLLEPRQGRKMVAQRDEQTSNGRHACSS